MNIKFQPCGTRILCEPIPRPKQKAGGLHIPETSNQDNGEGIVVRRGPKADPDIQVGDRILWSRNLGEDVKIGGTMFKLLQPADLLAIIG